MAIDKVNTAAAANIYKTAQNIGADMGVASDKDGVSFGSMVKEGRPMWLKPCETVKKRVHRPLRVMRILRLLLMR